MASTADELLRAAENEIESWLCELDARWNGILADATAEAERITGAARAQADTVVSEARAEAERIVAEAQDLAGEHADVIRALTTAEQEAAGDQLEALRDAVNRLRTELSRVVDAAFDTLPAIEATSAAIDEVLESPKRGILRRLFSRA